MIDSSSVRAHRCAAGSRKDSEPQEIRRSRGGRTTKIHAMVDGKGGLRRMRLSPGQAADRAEAAALLDGFEAGCGAVIPSKSYRGRQRPLDEDACAAYNIIKHLL